MSASTYLQPFSMFSGNFNGFDWGQYYSTRRWKENVTDPLTDFASKVYRKYSWEGSLHAKLTSPLKLQMYVLVLRSLRLQNPVQQSRNQQLLQSSPVESRNLQSLQSPAVESRSTRKNQAPSLLP